ncbi:hypothetical protein D3C72_848790 [compost metagenome]
MIKATLGAGTARVMVPVDEMPLSTTVSSSDGGGAPNRMSPTAITRAFCSTGVLMRRVLSWGSGIVATRSTSLPGLIRPAMPEALSTLIDLARSPPLSK